MTNRETGVNVIFPAMFVLFSFSSLYCLTLFMFYMVRFICCCCCFCYYCVHLTFLCIGMHNLNLFELTLTVNRKFTTLSAWWKYQQVRHTTIQIIHSKFHTVFKVKRWFVFLSIVSAFCFVRTIDCKLCVLLFLLEKMRISWQLLLLTSIDSVFSIQFTHFA